MRFKWYSLDKKSHSRELKVKQQRAKGCEARSNSLIDSIKDYFKIINNDILTEENLRFLVNEQNINFHKRQKNQQY